MKLPAVTVSEANCSLERQEILHFPNEQHPYLKVIAMIIIFVIFLTLLLAFLFALAEVLTSADSHALAQTGRAPGLRQP